MPLRTDTDPGAPCWIDLATSDKDRARSFYADLFGWTAQDMGDDFGGYINFLKDDQLVAGCMGKQSPDMPDTWNIYLASPDAAATAEAAAAEGATVVVPPMPVGDIGVMACVVDPAGVFTGIWQPKTHRGIGRIAEPGAPAWFEHHSRAYDTAVAFYRTVFGWDTHAQSDTPEFRYTTLGAADNQQAGMMDDAVMGPDGPPPHWAIYFNMPDADAAAARVVELGGGVVMQPENTPYGRLAVVTDPMGAMFSLIGDNKD